MIGTSPTAKRLYLTRHAEAEHNVASDWTIPDARLTDLGKKQSRELDDMTKDTIQRSAELLVSSCLRRPMETMLLGFPNLKSRLVSSGKPVILLEILQEVGPYPCDTPLHPVSVLAASNDGIFSQLDFSGISSDYASKTGIYAPEMAAERARKCRLWLRDRPEAEIVGVVVAHGDILRYMADGVNSPRAWANGEIKIFSFASSSDSQAALVEVGEVKPAKASDEPTSSEMN